MKAFLGWSLHCLVENEEMTPGRITFFIMTMIPCSSNPQQMQSVGHDYKNGLSNVYCV